MGLAKEGIREMLLATAVAAVVGGALSMLHPAAALPVVPAWAGVFYFFRDPRRQGIFAEGELCSPADGTVTEVTRLDGHEFIDGPAIRVGIFLSIFDVHINRAPCAGVVRNVRYKTGRFLDARHCDSGLLNESSTLVIEAEAPIGGPVVVRQIAGLVARRIVCHVGGGDTLRRGQRFGLIKFGSRTELIVPEASGIEIATRVGDKVKAGLTVLVRLAEPAGAVIAGHERTHESADQQPTRAPA